MSRIIIHLLQAEDCQDATFQDLLAFIQSNLKSKLIEIHSAKLASETSGYLQGEYLPFESFFSIAEAYRSAHSIRQQDFIFLITETTNEANFFCALGDGDSRVGFVHASAWSTCYADLTHQASATAYLVFSLVLRRFQYSADDYASYMELFIHGKFVHRDHKACFNNYAIDKTFIESQLSSAQICKSCYDLILAGGMESQHLAVIQDFFEKIRRAVTYFDIVDPYAGGLVYVYANHIEIRYRTQNNYATPAFSQATGKMTNFVLYVYLLIMNRPVGLNEWHVDASHYQLMRNIISIAQGAILPHIPSPGDTERFQELNVLKNYGTPDPKDPFVFINTQINKRTNDLNALFENAFLMFNQTDAAWAKSIAEEYCIRGTKDLAVQIDSSRIFYADCWINAFQTTYPHMQALPA